MYVCMYMGDKDSFSETPECVRNWEMIFSSSFSSYSNKIWVRLCFKRILSFYFNVLKPITFFSCGISIPYFFFITHDMFLNRKARINISLQLFYVFFFFVLYKLKILEFFKFLFISYIVSNCTWLYHDCPMDIYSLIMTIKKSWQFTIEWDHVKKFK